MPTATVTNSQASSVTNTIQGTTVSDRTQRLYAIGINFFATDWHCDTVSYNNTGRDRSPCLYYRSGRNVHAGSAEHDSTSSHFNNYQHPDYDLELSSNQHIFLASRCHSDYKYCHPDLAGVKCLGKPHHKHSILDVVDHGRAPPNLDLLFDFVVHHCTVHIFYQHSHQYDSKHDHWSSDQLPNYDACRDGITELHDCAGRDFNAAGFHFGSACRDDDYHQYWEYFD